ncbi:MAG: endopeptidase La, partial [Oscillospiraceae bacterium]|nr:endopeptidase La [Oscillospiraceae bacterium]
MTIVPVYNMLLTPEANIYFKTETYRKLTGREPYQDERVTLIVAKESTTVDKLTEDSFYPIGLSGYISEVGKEGFLIIHTTYRVHLDEVGIDDGKISLYISRQKDVNDLDPEDERNRVEAVKNALRDFLKESNWNEFGDTYLEKWNTLEEVAAILSPWMSNSNEERYAVLAEDS